MITKINGVEIKIPHEFNVSVNEIDGYATRNAKGDIIRDRIATKREIEVSFSALNENQSRRIMDAVSDLFFDVEYVDPEQGVTTKNFYKNGLGTSFTVKGADGTHYWKDLTFNIIER